MSTHYFVCKPTYDSGTDARFPDYRVYDKAQSSFKSQSEAIDVARRAYLAHSGKEEFAVLEAKIVYQPAVGNALGAKP